MLLLPLRHEQVAGNGHGLVDRPARAVTAQVDPERVLLLDANYTNNSRSLAPKTNAAARKWSLAWLVWLQDHLLTYGFFI